LLLVYFTFYIVRGSAAVSFSARTLWLQKRHQLKKAKVKEILQ
jgi:hypothetical protein